MDVRPPSSTSQSEINHEKQYLTTNAKAEPRSCLSLHRKRTWIILGGLFTAVIALGVGLGFGLTRGTPSASDTSDTISSSAPTATPLPSNANDTTDSFWKPSAGASWQIVLAYPLNDTLLDVSVYDIDLFDNPNTTISAVHALNRSVICYFSAGSYEDWRPDASQFKPSDYGDELDGWPGEYWLDTNSNNVRNIMSARLALASSKGCDGVDPDNVDGYANTNGLGLTQQDAVDYLTFLADGAHSLNMSLGLKNGGDLVNQTIDLMQWEVNEQCVQYDECDTFRTFIDAGKPVFHIEYPDSAPDISNAAKSSICDDISAQGFSTILKEMSLNDFVIGC